jgi:hypothetical protein
MTTTDEMRFAAALQRSLLTFEAGSSDDMGASARIMWRGEHIGSVVLSTLPNRAATLYVYGRDDVQVGTQCHAFYQAMSHACELVPGAFVDYTSFADWLEASGRDIADLMDCGADECSVCA